MNLDQITNQYDKLAAKKILLINDLSQKKSILRKAKREVKNNQDTRSLLNKAIETIHEIFKNEIQGTITDAVKKVFGRDLEFELRSEEKYNGIESRIIIKENGEEMEPEDDLGGSIIDIISFCFRIILWNMSSPRTRNVFVLDEPFKWTGKLIEFTGIILKQISEQMKIQLIVITHEDSLINIADRIFIIIHDGVESKVKTIRRAA